MSSKALALGSLAALGILIGVALIASAAGAMDEGVIPEAAEGTPAMERVQKAIGDLIRERVRSRDGSCGEDTDDFGKQVSEQAREQKKDGSCDECDPGDFGKQVSEQAREQKKDGSCGECDPGTSEELDGKEEQEPSGVQIQDRDRDQTNGGNGAQNRNSGN